MIARSKVFFQKTSGFFKSDPHIHKLCHTNNSKNVKFMRKVARAHICAFKWIDMHFFSLLTAVHVGMSEVQTLPNSRSRGREQGVRTHPHPLRWHVALKTMWFIGVMPFLSGAPILRKILDLLLLHFYHVEKRLKLLYMYDAKWSILTDFGNMIKHCLGCLTHMYTSQLNLKLQKKQRNSKIYTTYDWISLKHHHGHCFVNLFN